MILRNWKRLTVSGNTKAMRVKKETMSFSEQVDFPSEGSQKYKFNSIQRYLLEDVNMAFQGSTRGLTVRWIRHHAFS